MTNFCILLADNDPDFLSTCAEFLQISGYRVLKAASPAEARQALEIRRIHMAILDLRLINDDDQKDRSGLTLAKETARSVPKLILTKFPAHQDVREALKPDLKRLPPAVDFVDKRWGLDELLAAIEQTITKHVRINWDLTIRCGEPFSFPYLAHLIKLETDSTHLSDQAGELEDLFRKLFHERTQITISRLLTQGKGQAILEVFAYGEGSTEAQFVVSCGRRQRIKEEGGRYETFVPRGTGAGSIGKVKTEETIHFAATAYTLVGGDLEETTTFGEFYRNRPAEDVLAALDHLFNTTLAHWYEKGRFYEESKALIELHLDWLGMSDETLSPPMLERRVEAICKEALATGLPRLDYSSSKLTLRLSDGSSTFPNPVRYLCEGQIAFGQPVLCGVTHGKADVDTVLVDRGGRTWVVDFTQAGHGPLLRDFLSLEMAIKLDLLDTTDLPMRHELERRLLSMARLDDTVNVEGLPSELEKALRAVECIRHLAADLAGHNPEPYLSGLVFCAVGRIVAYDPSVRYTRRELAPYAHSLLVAAMLCERLMASAQSLAELPAQALDGLWIDEPDKEVWVEGRRIDLTPQEFDILAHLYKHAGQLCSRRTIVEEALGEEFKEAITEETRLNSAMSRLRQKIEPDPDHPKYTITVRGHGYKLML